MTRSFKIAQAAQPGSLRARSLPAPILALAAWLLLALVLLAVGLAVHGEQASALVQSETASPATGSITATAGTLEMPVLPPLITPTVTVAPTDTPAPTAAPTQPPPTPEPAASWTPTPLPEPINTAQTGASSQTRRHYVRGDSNVVFQWGMLVDSLALGISYAWLAGGILVGVGLPILFVVLWIRTRRRRPARE